MTKKEIGMFGKASVLLVLGLALGGCGDTHAMKSQGQTHWLQQCDGDTDCGALSCECGVCVAPCDTEGACSIAGVEAQCFERGSGAVRALCGQEHEVPLCLQACDDACGSGQSCEANACLPSRSPRPDGGMGPDGSVGLPGPDGSVGLPGPDGSVGLPGPDASTNDGGFDDPDGMFTIGLRNESSSPVVLFVSGCMGEQHWFDMHEIGGVDLPGNGETLAITTNPTSCDCRGQSYEEAECFYPPPVCGESVFETLEPNAAKIYNWDTGHWFPTRDVPCSNRRSIGTGTQLELRACWLSEMPASDNLRYPDDYICATSTFMLSSRTGSEWVTITD